MRRGKGKTTLDFDMKSGQHVTIESGGLRVWQKQNGTWKLAAYFMNAYDRDLLTESGLPTSRR